MTDLILRSPVMLLWWAVQIAIKLPTMLINLVLMPLAYQYKNTNLSSIPRYMMFLINPEDQLGGFPGFEDSLPPFWKNEYGVGRWAHYKYNAIRNPADGLRNIAFLNVIPEPSKIKFVTNQYLRHYEPRLINPLANKLAYYFCWQGFWLGMQIVYVWNDERYLTFKWGFRIQPSDSYRENIDPKGTRNLIGASMATKFLPYRKWS